MLPQENWRVLKAPSACAKMAYRQGATLTCIIITRVLHAPIMTTLRLLTSAASESQERVNNASVIPHHSSLCLSAPALALPPTPAPYTPPTSIYTHSALTHANHTLMHRATFSDNSSKDTFPGVGVRW